MTVVDRFSRNYVTSFIASEAPSSGVGTRTSLGSLRNEVLMWPECEAVFETTNYVCGADYNMTFTKSTPHATLFVVH